MHIPLMVQRGCRHPYQERALTAMKIPSTFRWLIFQMKTS